MGRFKYKMTIIEPSYNNGQYLRQSLDSILMQEVDFEYQIIIADDASQDDSPQITQEYAEKYPDRILALYSDKNCGLFQNTLKALKKMDSEYFCVLDPDDYWTDKKRLQKAVDFLDANPDYTIYAANTYALYNDGTITPYYKYSVDEGSSTFEDYLRGKALLSNTPASTYRNIYFSDGIPKEFADLEGGFFEVAFCADTARHLIHLNRGKAYFVNESVGYARRTGKGHSSGLLRYEAYIRSAYAYMGFSEFFGSESKEVFERWAKDTYITAAKLYCKELVAGKTPKVAEEFQKYFKAFMEWLPSYQDEESCTRIPFSLKNFREMENKKTVIWGTGLAASRIIKEYSIPIRDDTFFVDNDESKHGDEFIGRPIKSPMALKEEKDALVVIASSYYKEIISQIIEERLCDEGQVINIYDYEKFHLV